MVVVSKHCCLPTRLRSWAMEVYLEGVGTTFLGLVTPLGIRTVLRAGSVGQVHRSRYSCWANAPGWVMSTWETGLESGQVETCSTA